MCIETTHYTHGNILSKKKDSCIEMHNSWEKYVSFRRTVDVLHICDEQSIRAYVEALNLYRRETLYYYESLDNSGQQNLRSTILEEAFQHLFKDLVVEILGEERQNLVIGKENSYVSMSFTPKSFTDLVATPQPYIHTKDQDFILGCSSNFIIFANEAERAAAQANHLVVPAVAIECKTYLERNMLDSCAATAERLKNAMPYCLYIVASEFLKMDDAEPELSRIDEVYILCKASNAERLAKKEAGQPPHDIDPVLMIDLFNMVKRHLNSIWWSPNDALERGKIINRP